MIINPTIMHYMVTKDHIPISFFKFKIVIFFGSLGVV